MSFWKEFAQLDRKFAWSFVGSIVGVVSIIVAVYIALVYEKKPAIQFDIVSEANVLEVREQLGKLSILFDGDNISQKGLNLRIFTIKVSNVGQVDITQPMFDQTKPWGFRITDGRIIEANPLESNSDYLRTDLKPTIHAPDSVFFEKVILERDKFISLKLLIIHDASKSPSLLPMGKIAGMDNIQITKSFQEKTESNFWTDSFRGGLLMQLVRILAYPIALIILILFVAFGIVLPFSDAADRRKKRKRVSLVEKYKDIYKSSIVDTDSIFLDSFLVDGIEPIRSLIKMISNKSQLRSALDQPDRSNLRNMIVHSPSAVSVSNEDAYRRVYVQEERVELVKKFSKSGLIRREGTSVEVDKQLGEHLRQFSRFLKSADYDE
ncbi:MAG: hypothetical protein NTX44_05110 [Ignavibacteriales bacterium]|nr:hypothetical protein [Ignavibacteriales bacterium]